MRIWIFVFLWPLVGVLYATPKIFSAGPDSPFGLSEAAHSELAVPLSKAHSTSPAKITPVPTMQPKGWVYYRAGKGDEASGLLEIWSVDEVSFEFRLSHWVDSKRPCEVRGVAGRAGKRFVWRRIFGKIPGKIIFKLKGQEAIEVFPNAGVRDKACGGAKKLKGGIYRLRGPLLPRKKLKH